MELFLSNLNYVSFLSFFFIALILNLLFISNFKFQFHKSRNAQDIHDGDISRLGGFVIFILFFIFEIFYIKYINHFTWVLIVTILIPAFFEDIKITSHPYFRLAVMLIGSVFIIMNMPQLPLFNFGNLNFFINHQLFQVCFFAIAIVAIMNGQNLIDGVHGLSAVQGLCSFSCILILGLHVNNFLYVQASLIMIFLLISFLMYNYPLGKIFLGDLGSYFIGLIASFFIIDIFAQNPQLPTWLAVIILFYAAFEVIFSYARKVIARKSPFYPDNKHLHTSIFYYLNIEQKKSSKISNILVMPFLFLLWLSPVLFFIISLHYTFFAIAAIFILAFAYLTYYFVFHKLNNDG